MLQGAVSEYVCRQAFCYEYEDGIAVPFFPFFRVSLSNQSRPARLQRLRIGRNDPRPSGHYARAVIVEEVRERRKTRPRFGRRRQKRVAPACRTIGPVGTA